MVQYLAESGRFGSWQALNMFNFLLLRGCDLRIVLDHLEDLLDIIDTIDLHRVLQLPKLTLITPHLSPVLLTLCDVTTTALLRKVLLVVLWACRGPASHYSFLPRKNSRMT